MVVDKSDEPGTVTVTIAPESTQSDVWRALIEPASVCQWFGDLSGPLREGETARLDFGDGDFFELSDIHLEPPDLAQYSWRFMGTGASNTISWHIVPAGKGCLVTVVDRQPGRSGEEVQILKQGWLDFTQRLEGFLATGEPTRYAWRREIDASIELAGPVEAVWDILFAPDLQPQWLPLNGTLAKTGVHQPLTDNLEPGSIVVANVLSTTPGNMEFQLTHEDWLHPTTCQLELSPHGDGSMLTVHHVGWEAISFDAAVQREQRRRFSELWVESLERARGVIEGAREQARRP